MERNIWEVISKEGLKKLQKEFKVGHHISEKHLTTTKYSYKDLYIIIIRQKRETK